MNETTAGMTGKVLGFAAIVEVGTGLALLFDPAMVVALLVGGEVRGVAILLGRCFGIALVALGLACWPGVRSGLRGMLAYNGLIAIYLGYVGGVGLARGWLLWPAVALHAGVALLLVRQWRRDTPR